MKSISELDSNLKTEEIINEDGIVYRNILSSPFRVYGLIREENRWVRVPDSVARTVSVNVTALSKQTAGGRVRFRTDARTIYIKVKMPTESAMGHMPGSGQTGFDIYAGDGKEINYLRSFVPPVGVTDSYSLSADVGTGMKTLTLNFPLYHAVNDVYIGLSEGAVLEEAPDYAIEMPIVFYGSSITQGGCASRPGNSYQGFVCRHFDADHINLGFSGNAKGEDTMAEYIASLDMSVFVYDYDHNAPTLEHLEATHERFFRIIRAAKPTLPIVFMTRPVYFPTEGEVKRKEIIRKTYENALAEGDENVYFIDGRELMELCGNNGTVDGCHPTDLGFFSMAKRVIKELEPIIDRLS